MKTQHTQGPWVVIEKQTSCGVMFTVGPQLIAAADHGGICLYDHHTTLNPHKEGEQEANAKLIASAPELLEICEDIKESLKTLYQDASVIAGEYFGAALSERLNDIIKKAKGES